MLISNTKPGRTDGGYTRVLGDIRVGALVSRVQSAVISAGTELERLITERAKICTDVNAFVKGSLKPGIYLLQKKTLKKSVLKTKQEPDFLVVNVSKKNCHIIELKDGDAFDTKKAAGEVSSLKAFQNQIGSKIPYKTSIHICFFNQDNRKSIVDGFKGQITKDQALTGLEFCKLLNINYKEVIGVRKKDAIKNFNFFLTELADIPRARRKLENLLKQTKKKSKQPKK